MRNRSLLFVLFTVCASSFAQEAPLIDAAVREKAAAAVSAGAYPSLVIGVVEAKRVEVVAFGSIGGDRKPDGDTLYEIGSVTKTFTGLLLADAAERGEVALDEPLQKVLDDYPIPGGPRAITLLDLATQSSGLPRLPANFAPKDPANPYAGYRIEDLKEFLSNHELAHAPGEHYQYSNLGFGLLARALERRAKSPFADLVRARITKPLGMKDTAIVLSPAMRARLAPAHDPNGKPTPAWDMGIFDGAGALRSTANDLLTYVRAQMRPAGPLAKAIKTAVREHRKTDGGRIGLGWQLGSSHGRDLVWHDGRTGGYASFAGFTADGARGVVVLTNISRPVNEIGLELLAPRVVPKEIAVDAATLPAYAGRYPLAPGFVLDVTVSDGQLFVQATAQPRFPVFALGADRFFYKVVDAELQFERGTDGKVDAVVLHQNGQQVRGKKED